MNLKCQEGPFSLKHLRESFYDPHPGWGPRAWATKTKTTRWNLRKRQAKIDLLNDACQFWWKTIGFHVICRTVLRATPPSGTATPPSSTVDNRSARPQGGPLRSWSTKIKFFDNSTNWRSNTPWAEGPANLIAHAHSAGPGTRYLDRVDGPTISKCCPFWVIWPSICIIFKNKKSKKTSKTRNIFFYTRSFLS